jgi:hypothetical protein
MDNKFLDVNGYITPQISNGGKPADNAILFESVAVLLGLNSSEYVNKVKSCYLKKGLVARWPGNDFDQVAYDDYLGIAAASIYLGEKSIPRDIMWYGLTHAFIFNTNGKITGDDFLIRHFHVWPLMLVAAFPILKYLMYPMLMLMTLFFSYPDMNDTSGFQLQWVYFKAMNKLGFSTEIYRVHELYRKKAFLIYYDKDHPFNKTVD